jgi:hypothetical protein
MSYEIKGTVKRIGAVETKGAKAFKTRDLILDVEDGKFPQVIALQATGDRVSLLDPLNVGDSLTVTFNLRGREWTGQNGTKVFNSLDVWKLDVTSKAAPSYSGGGSSAQDDIPFLTCDVSAEPSAIAKVLR